jgi:predicted permease
LFISGIRGDKRKLFKTALIFLAVSAFCFVFGLVYTANGRGVSSIYMTSMFLFPLTGGSAAYLAIGMISKARMPGRMVTNVYNSGIATLTIWSMLHGIFDIAGTSSTYEPVFLIAGALMVFAGAACYFAAQSKNSLMRRQ